jgi:Protein of unknown function (DUF2612)/PASTA domain
MPILSPWVRVDAGISPGEDVTDVAILSNTVAIALTADDRVLRSADGGNTWVEVVGAIPGTTGVYIAGGDGKAVIRGTNGGTGHLYSTPDLGLTWNDVTPIGCDPRGSTIEYLSGMGVFEVCDSVANIIWASDDGVTWTGNVVIGLPGDSIFSFGRQFLAETAGVAVFAGFSINPDTYWVLASSPDGHTWTVGHSDIIAPIHGLEGTATAAWNGSVFSTNALLDDFYTNATAPDGMDWTIQNNVAVPPPYTRTLAVLNSQFYSGDPLTADIAISSDDGITWTSDTVPDLAGVFFTASPSLLFAWSNGIDSTNGMGWTGELAPFSGDGAIERLVYGNGYALATGLDDSDNGGIWLRSFAPVETEVPPVVGLPQAVGVANITGVGLIVGSPIPTQPSLQFAAGIIMFQDPPGGTEVDEGTAVNIIVSSGWIEVPDVEDKTAAAANAAILAANLSVGAAGTAVSKTVKFGNVVSQSPAPKTHVLPGTPVSYDISAPNADFDVDATVISQYANSPTLLRLVHNMAEYIDRSRDLATFYQFVWNVDTAVGFGLDIWGKIVGVSRLLQIPGDDPIVGFDNADTPKDWFPMSQGRFATENEATTAFLLPDDAYRVLILTKALANIITTTAPAVNQLLRNLFPGRGRCFVRDLGNMAMEFVFNFRLTKVEYAILTQSGALPHPAGVFYSVVVIPTGLFGFQGYTGALPFNFGVFNSRP